MDEKRNERILFRLIKLFQILNKTLYSLDLSEDQKLSKIKSEFYETQRLVAEDVGNFYSNNIFQHPGFREVKLPKQFIHVQNEKIKKPFIICLN